MSNLTQTETETIKSMLDTLRKDGEEGVRVRTQNLAAEIEALAAESLEERDGAAGAGSREQVDGTMLDRHLIELRDLDAALKRLEEGNYGICIDCDAAIAFGRLRAYPTAKRCAPCQAKCEHLRQGAAFQGIWRSA